MRAMLTVALLTGRPRHSVVAHEGSWASRARALLAHNMYRLLWRAHRLQLPCCMFVGVKVFTATKAKERELLGEAVTQWLRDNPRARIVDKIVTQSSDDQFHCLTITLFYASEE
jgi:hypothetical protein